SLLAEGSLLVEDSLPVEDSLFVEDSSASEELTPSDDIQIVDETVENFEPVSLEFEEAGQVDSESALSDESAVSVESTDLSDEFTPSDDALLVDGAIDELDTISLELSSDDSEESISESVEVERSSDYEPVLVEVFRKEATNHISAIREFLLNASGEPTEVDDELHRAFHTLLGSARMAGVLSISTLSEPSDKLIRTMHEANLSVDSKGQVLLHDIADAIETLAADFDRVDFSEPDHSDILNRIAELHDAVLLISKKVEIVQESIDSISDLPSSEESDNEEAEDAELISIFVEEADEILQGSDAMMQQWQQGGDDLHAIAELQRALHTLKGGARLAGFAPIGDLTHELEALLEAVAEGRRSTDEQLPPLVQQGLDWLGAAIQQIKTGAGAAVTPAEDLLLQIEHLASSSSAPDSIEPESVEPVSNETIAEDIDDAQPEIDLSELVEPYVEPSVESGLEPESFDTTADADKESDELLLDEDTIPASLTTPAAPEEIVEEGFEELTQELIEEPHFTSNIEPEAVAAATDVDYDPDLLEVFLEEAEEIQESTEQALQDWSSQLDNLDHVAELQRLLHTLKGGARMANVLAVGDLAHEMESLLERIADRRTTPTAEHTDLIQTCHDWLIGALEEARKLQPTSVPSELIAGLNAAIKGEQYSAEGSEPSFQAEETAPEDDTTASEITTESRETPEPTPVSVAEQTVEMEDFTEEFDLESTVIDITTRKTETAATDEQVRVRAELLNNLVNFSGEINIFNSRISQQLGASRFNLAELDQTVLRLREQLRNFEIETETQIMYRHETTTTDSEDFDPLELDRFSTMQQLSRSMVESLGDLTSIQTLLDNLSSETDVLLLQQQRVTSELQEGLMRTRMVSFSSILPRLRRIMRQTCKEVGKEAELQVEGGEGELDRTQLNRIVPALEHIMRNAIGHGLELPKERTKLGKPASGNVEILFSHQGSEVVLTISDDGTGINIDALRAKAIEKGRMQADADLTDNEIIEFILESGFSTATEVTQISGRGVGMDVVNSEVKQLGGTLHIDSQPGKGTTFTLRLPLTVLVNQALMVQVADASYAIQLPNIEHVVRVSNKELAPMISSEQTDFEYAGNHYQYLNLGTILHGTPPILPTDKQRVPLMLIHSADHRIALHVDNLFGRQEIVIKSVGPQLSTVGVLSGATILPNGEVALILDIANLVRSALAQMHGKAVPLLPSIAESAAEKALIPTVMIVDDSITVRKVTERLLKRYEYNIITAKDGVDALTVMLEQVPDIMLLDVEMPRMDGYELATTMRNDARLKQVPIIMITSRTGDKHRKRAMDIGVDMYMGKPYQEHDLISNIRTLTGVEQG
ncbi:MAG: Hpt domain-containing protein, partial [Ectothiorhodospiraceae bacterium]|nr:Hpt domain-containing protein [Ectothiorhodospiraceae bacterium]